MLALLKLAMGPISNYLKGRKDSKDKQAAATMAWETATGKSMLGSWKDEYVTIVITWPIVQLFVGNLVAAFSDDTRIMLANQQSLIELGALMDTPYGKLMMVVVLAAVGIKGLKVLGK